MTDSKTTEKRKRRADEREAVTEALLDVDPAAEVMATRRASKNAELAIGAIKVLQRVVPDWSRKERRALANAIRLGGKGYTK